MRVETIGDATLYLGDCMAYMATQPDHAFDLAIVDPPYGIGASEMTMGSGKNKKYAKGKQWDHSAPDGAYFQELARVSKHQIIWGGNYFPLPLTKCWIFWDKGIEGDCSFADGELAWGSFDKVLRKADVRYKGFLGADTERIHPTQKPVKLYSWLLANYAQRGQRILDTHLGSGSSAIAANAFGCEFHGIELDPEYFAGACKRIEQAYAQGQLFAPARPKAVQESFL
jgi:site-specific DNA-methyltransferase (adenine-specific)